MPDTSGEMSVKPTRVVCVPCPTETHLITLLAGECVSRDTYMTKENPPKNLKNTKKMNENHQKMIK